MVFIIVRRTAGSSPFYRLAKRAKTKWVSFKLARFKMQNKYAGRIVFVEKGIKLGSFKPKYCRQEKTTASLYAAISFREYIDRYVRS